MPKLTIVRQFTEAGTHPFDRVKWTKRDAVITDPQGGETFRQDDVEAPEFWSDRAVKIVAEKYLRMVNGAKESSVKQMIGRVVQTITAGGSSADIFASLEDALAFQDELTHMLLFQMFSFNSPVWFNVGVVDHPQASACFIQSVVDSMESITDLARKEIKLFKGGSGTGSNLSNLRSSIEKLTGGGLASGPVSFMKLYDAGASVTKSGGTTRRAAKLVCLDADHPDILEQKSGEAGFIRCKSYAEQLAHDLYSTGKYTAEFNVPGNVYDLVGFQNANLSVRAPDEFMKAVVNKETWVTKKVTDGEPVHTYSAEKLFDEIAEAAWICGDPGLQFDTTINEWHTCKASGRINASNPCSEYMFLDDSACNLGSLNLTKFLGSDNKLDAQSFVHACGTAITAMEILVGMSGYPSPEIAANSHKFRPLGLGYANLGGFLISIGVPYDSDEGRRIAASITSLMTAAAYAQSAKLAAAVGPFEGFALNRDSMLDVIAKHAQASDKLGNRTKIAKAANDLWAETLKLGVEFGYRNAQATVLAPTGTIAFMMDCETTGVEPALALVQHKKLVGGGSLVMPLRIVGKGLEALNYNEADRKTILAHMEHKGSLNGCAALKETHLAVFATAFGTNSIHPTGHIEMMAAVQPYISGAISKTVNLGADATKDEIRQIYLRAWELKLKAIAVYRDGCKLSQPVAASLTSNAKKEVPLAWGERKRMPNTRPSITHKMRIGEHEGYVTVGKYPDGQIGEIFVTMSTQGSTLRGLMDAWATAMSLALQHGVPLETIISKMKHVQFEPAGWTDDERFRVVQSIPDYLARWLEAEILYPPKPSDGEKVEAEVHAATPADRSTISGPPCSGCGNLTVRAGTCWVCSSCGRTTGCG